MSVSQFTIYSSSDVSAPQLSGQVGSLLGVLDACLVQGYGSKAAAGWTKPVANSSNCGCYKNGTGSSQLVLFINDNAPNATSVAREAWATGWETIAGVAAPVGSGGGQFPLPSQQLTSGHGVIRKSVAADATSRPWVVVADAYTMYCFIMTGDTAGVYYPFMFGDIYSSKLGSPDAYRCLLIARSVENSASANGATAPLSSCIEGFDLCYGLNANSGPIFYTPGNWMPRSYGGAGLPVSVVKTADASVLSIGAQMVNGNQYYPILFTNSLRSAVNMPDGSIDISPVVVFENGQRRGRLRGLYIVCCASGQVADGVTFSGAGDYAGKTFQAIRPTVNSATFAIETSNTVETN